MSRISHASVMVFGSVTWDGSQSSPTEEGVVLALLERHEVVCVPELLGAQVAVEILADNRVEFEDQRVRDRFLCHAVTVTRRHRFREI